MNARMQASFLPDGRLHLNDGPIDLVIGAEAAAPEARRACAAARDRFSTVLDELCAELALLRCAASADARPQGAVAQRMHTAVLPFAATGFITPMAAVAGAVADEVLAAMTGAAELTRAYVNNGGDIALHLAPGAHFDIGVAELPQTPNLFGAARLESSAPARGVATSGWPGRSFSLGIADSVTVFAATAAAADAAATVVANAVDLPGHAAVTRVRACDLDPQSDLGARTVTRGVGLLTPAEIADALARGRAVAQRLLESGRIVAAALRLQGTTHTVGALDARPATAQNGPMARIARA